MNHWFLLSFLLLPLSTHACRTPSTGATFNNQIEVRYLKENGAFSIHLPARLHESSTKDATLYLTFHSLVDGKRKPALTKRVTLKTQGKYLMGDLHIAKTNHYQAYLEAHWWPAFGEACTSAVGTKELKML